MDSRRQGTTRVLRLHQSVARQLGMAILSGQYVPGDNLGGEIEQSDALRVSRTAYREALRILIAKGLVESRPKAGTHVAPRGRWNLLDPEILAWMFSGEPDEVFVRSLFELRGIIEPAAAELAAERRTDDHLAIMRAALDDMRCFGLATEEGQAADHRFHHAMMEATGNEALSSLAGSVSAAVQWTTHFKQRARGTPRDPLPEHQALYDALAARQPELARRTADKLIALALKDMEPLR